MVRTRVGYSGGMKVNPTYHALGDHTESVQLDYDPEEVSYEELLSIFWDSHDATASSWSRQYMSIIFYHDEEQKRLAIASRDREAAKAKRPIVTEIRPAGPFYRAEGYHQKFRLRSERNFLAEYQAIYPAERDFVDSTAVARVNGYLDGYGTLKDLQADLPSLGLSPETRQRLEVLVSRRPGRTGCPI